MKLLKRILISFFAVFIVLLSAFCLWVYTQHITPILMYHQVERSIQSEAQKINPELFDRHMELLQKFNFEVVSLDMLVKKIKSNEPIPHRWVVITFDDGIANNYTHAFPILKKYKNPAIIFIPSDKINSENHLTWDQVREMHSAGIDFGSHTRFHTYLPSASENTMEDEVVHSKKIIERQLNTTVDYFSYPIGGFNDLAKQVVEHAGYQAAVTTNRGFDPENKDLFELNRVRLSNSDRNPFYLWVKFAGYSNAFHKGKKPY